MRTATTYVRSTTVSIGSNCSCRALSPREMSQRRFCFCKTMTKNIIGGYACTYDSSILQGSCCTMCASSRASKNYLSIAPSGPIAENVESVVSFHFPTTDRTPNHTRRKHVRPSCSRYGLPSCRTVHRVGERKDFGAPARSPVPEVFFVLFFVRHVSVGYFLRAMSARRWARQYRASTMFRRTVRLHSTRCVCALARARRGASHLQCFAVE
jgi:hypothetical protein